MKGPDIGLPAGTPGDVVDAAGHDAYRVDPLHLEFVARNELSAEQVQVFDSR